MKTIKFLAAAATLAGPITTSAAEPFRLVCAYEFTINENGDRTPTSGEALLTITPTGAGRAIIQKQGLGAEFLGAISDEVIRGQTKYQIQKTFYEESLEINRFTGAMELHFRPQTGVGLIHFGRCRAAAKPLF